MTNSYEYTIELDDKSLDASSAPSAANAAATSVLSSSLGPAPIIVPPADSFVRLPGGLVVGGNVVNSAEVQELTGEHEETIAKANNGARFISALLRCGVVSIGDDKASPHLLKSLSIGDREMLILGIRRATFGNDVEFDNFTCPHCGEAVDISIPLDKIPVKTLEDPAKQEYAIPLRKGGNAYVRIPNGFDQEAVLENETLSVAEQNSLMLAQIVQRIEDADGRLLEVKKRPSVVKGLGIADRKAILRWCTEIQPGPQYDDVKFTHETCDKEVPLFLTVGDLFRDL